MNSRKFIQCAVILILAASILACGVPLSTSTPVPPILTSMAVPPTVASIPVPGVDTPLNIEGVELRITSATRKEYYDNPITKKRFTPNDPKKDEVMIVEAKVLSGDIDKVSDWREVWITDENGRETSPGSVTTKPDGTVIWPIVVEKSSRSFTLHLPGSLTVKLDTLIK